MSFLRKQQSRLLGPQQSPSPGLAFGPAGLSRRGRGGLFHSDKMLQDAVDHGRHVPPTRPPLRLGRRNPPGDRLPLGIGHIRGINASDTSNPLLFRGDSFSRLRKAAKCRSFPRLSRPCQTRSKAL